MQKSKLTGPYVDPSFYAGEPFWTPGGSELQPYPLRPMPPRIFYPAIPSSYKGLGRWSGSSTRLPHGQMPLFILASRQFTRKPYSARPNERTSSSSSFSGPSGGVGWAHDGVNSRRSSTSSNALDLHNSQRMQPSFSFKVHIDEVEAAAELLEALRYMDDKGEKAFSIPKLQEETQRDLELDLENELMDNDILERQERMKKEYAEISMETSSAQNSNTSSPTVSEAAKAGLGEVPSDNNYRKHLLISSQAKSIDSTSSTSTYALESILEEKGRNPPMITYSEDESMGYDQSTNIPGFIPDETEPRIISTK